MAARAVPVVGASGEVAEWIGVHTDVHEQQVAAAALAASEARFQSIFDSITDVVLVYTLTPEGPGPIRAFNKAATDTYGYAPEALHQMSIADIVAPGSLSISDAIERLRQEYRATFESVHLTREGRRIHMATSARLVEYDGELCVLAVCRDDTEAKAFRNDIARANLRSGAGRGRADP